MKGLRLKWHILRLVIYVALAASALYASYLTYSQRRDLGVVFTNIAPESGTVLRKVAYVSGEVVQPGMYEIEAQMRVSDLVDMAGGFTGRADQNFIAEKLNLAAVVEDEQHIFVPATNAEVASSPGANTKLVNINTATAPELMTLPGIGSSFADKIISGRPWKAIADLRNLSGLGEAKFNSIKDLVSL